MYKKHVIAKGCVLRCHGTGATSKYVWNVEPLSQQQKRPRQRTASTGGPSFFSQRRPRPHPRGGGARGAPLATRTTGEPTLAAAADRDIRRSGAVETSDAPPVAVAPRAHGGCRGATGGRPGRPAHYGNWNLEEDRLVCGNRGSGPTLGEPVMNRTTPPKCKQMCT